MFDVAVLPVAAALYRQEWMWAAGWSPRGPALFFWSDPAAPGTGAPEHSPCRRSHHSAFWSDCSDPGGRNDNTVTEKAKIWIITIKKKMYWVYGWNYQGLTFRALSPFFFCCCRSSSSTSSWSFACCKSASSCSFLSRARCSFWASSTLAWCSPWRWASSVCFSINTFWCSSTPCVIHARKCLSLQKLKWIYINEMVIKKYRSCYTVRFSTYKRCCYLVFLQLGFMCCFSRLSQSIVPVLNLMTQLCNLCNTHKWRMTDRLVLEYCITQNTERTDMWSLSQWTTVMVPNKAKWVQWRMNLTSFSFSLRTWVSPWIVLSRFRAFFFSELSSSSFSSNFTNKFCWHERRDLVQWNIANQTQLFERAKCHLCVPCFDFGYPPAF